MRSFYITEQNKLENTQKHLERCQHFIIRLFEKYEGVEFQQILQPFQLSRVNSDEAASKLEVHDILAKLKYVRKAVVLEYGSNIPDLKSFQEDLTNIMSAVQDMNVNSKVKVEELVSEENLLDEDIKLYNERLSCWSESVKLDSLKSEVHSKINSSSRVPEDVEKFMDFVRCSNGHENGWSVSDNQLFLKLRKKSKNLDEVAQSLNKILPDIRVEDVKIHDAWYAKYLNLKEKHNTAIKNWKKQKQEIKTDLEVVNQCEKSEELKKNPVYYTKMSEQKYIEKKKIKEEIEKWKREREVVKRINKAMLAEESKKKRIKENRQEEINKVKSKMVMQWKANKIGLEKERLSSDKMKHNMEHNVRVAVANKMIKLYQMQDKIFLNKKIHISTNKMKNDREPKPRNCCEVTRDPNRLFRPTKQWINRFLANNENVSIRQVNFINKIPKLQIPSWRKDL